MDDKNLQLSEKFSQLVIEGALRTQGPALLDRLVKQINEGSRGDIARIQGSIGVMSEDITRLNKTILGIDESLQSVTKWLQSLDRRAGTDAESPAVQWKKLCDGIERLNLGLQKESSAKSKELQELALSLQKAIESRIGQSAASSSPTTIGPLNVSHFEEKTARGQTETKMNDTTLAVARTAALACMLVLFGGLGGALAVLKMHEPATGKPMAVNEDGKAQFNAQAAPPKHDGDNVSARPGYKEPWPAPELPPPPPAPTINEALFDELVIAMKKRATADDLSFLSEQLKKRGVDISTGRPDRGLTLGDLEYLAKQPEAKRTAALFLQALVVVRGERVAADFQVDGKFGDSSKTALSEVQCVADAKNLQRIPSSKQLIDPRKQVVEIIKACASV